MYSATLISVEFLSGLHGTPASTKTSRKSEICSVMRRDRCCSLALRSCRLRSRSDSSSDIGNEEGSLPLLVPLLLEVVVLMLLLMDCITGGATVMVGIVKASRCVKAEGPIITCGFFGGGGKSEAVGIVAGAPGCFEGLCGGGGGKVVVCACCCCCCCVCDALATEVDDFEDATDGSVETTPCGCPVLLLYAELTSSLSKSRSSDAVN